VPLKFVIYLRYVCLGFIFSGLLLVQSPFIQAASRGAATLQVHDSSGKTVGGYRGSYALVIGVSDYTQGWPDLNSIPAEMDKVEKVLKTQGFKVKKVINPNSRKLLSSMRDFIDTYGFEPNNRLLFYFSGHGYTRKNGTLGYLVPADAPVPKGDERPFLRKALDMDEVLFWAKKIEAKHALFLFDSCFSGTIFKQRALPKAPAHITAMTTRPVRQFITAGSAGETVPAKSVFTPAFVDALKYGLADLNNDGYISGTELGLYLQQTVPQHSDQTPQYGKISDYDLSRGDFILLAHRLNDTSKISPEVSRLQVQSNPVGAEILIDGESRGHAPLNIDYQKGRAEVVARISGYHDAVKKVRLHNSKTMQLNFNLEPMILTGTINITSSPAGAEWYMDGDYMGTTPDYFDEAEPGKHTLSVKYEGYKAWADQVSITGEQSQSVVVQLTQNEKSLETAHQSGSINRGEGELRAVGVGVPADKYVKDKTRALKSALIAAFADALRNLVELTQGGYVKSKTLVDAAGGVESDIIWTESKGKVGSFLVKSRDVVKDFVVESDVITIITQDMDSLAITDFALVFPMVDDIQFKVRKKQSTDGNYEVLFGGKVIPVNIRFLDDSSIEMLVDMKNITPS